MLGISAQETTCSLCPTNRLLKQSAYFAMRFFTCFCKSLSLANRKLPLTNDSPPLSPMQVMNDASTLYNLHTQVSRKNFLPSEELNLVTMFVLILSWQPNGIYFYFALIGAACPFSNANGTYQCIIKEMLHDSSSHSSCLPNHYMQNVVSCFRDAGSLKKRCQFSHPLLNFFIHYTITSFQKAVYSPSP